MSSTETEILQQSIVQSQVLQQQLQSLLKNFRPLLENPAFSEPLAEAESYLYDVQDALSDFEEDCQDCLDAWQEAQT